MTKQYLLCSWLGLAASVCLFAQKSPGSANPGAGRLPTLTTPTQQPNQQPGQGTDLPRPLYVAGRVTLDDGTSPPEPVRIQIMCGTSPRSIGYTDSKGRFDLDLNDRRTSSTFADASQNGSFDPQTGGTSRSQRSSPQNAAGSSGRSYAGCELQASLAGFRSDRVNLNNRRSLEDPNVGTLILHRLANVEGLTISGTSAMAPKESRKAFEKALNAEKKGKWTDAQHELEKAVDLYPRFAAAWFHLGFSQQHQDNLAGARQSYAKSLAADPHFVSPYQQLAVLAAREKNWTEVAEDTDRLLRLDPVDFPDAWLYNALANLQLQRFDLAERSARQGISVDTEHHYPKMDHVLAMLLVQKHQYPEAAEHLKSYLLLVPDAPDAERARLQLAEVERLMRPQTAQKSPE
jgi:tetratricopeptide (TPR) repeat protein